MFYFKASLYNSIKNFSYSFFCNLIFISIIILFYFISGKYFPSFDFYANHHAYYLKFIFSLLPLVSIYLLFRVLFGGFLSCLNTLLVALIILVINKEKMAATMEPISWIDLINVNNLWIAINYIELKVWLFVIIGSVVYLLILFKFIRDIKLSERFCYLLLFFAVMPFSFYVYFDWLGVGKYKISNLLSKGQISYISWDYPANVKMHGIFSHLIHTSQVKLIQPEEGGDIEFSLLANHSSNDEPAEVSNVFYILCESCWFDENNFGEAFNPFYSLGFTSFRSRSPVYGGGTVNASFEMITGLSSTSVLSGVIYQEYESIFKNNVSTLASKMREKGYATAAYHPFIDNFWKRDRVAPKFGFEQYFGLSSMNYDGPIYFPRDKIVFDFVLNNFNPLDKKFHYISTIHTHGAYAGEDHGLVDYTNRLQSTANDILSFVKKIKEKDENSLIVIFGDHRPALNGVFFDREIIPRNFFLDDDNSQFVLGPNTPDEHLSDVPFLVYSKNKEILRKLSKSADSQPMFCVSQKIDEFFLKTNLPSYRFTKEMCSQSLKRGESKNLFPSWIYYYSLFSDTKS